MAEKYGTKQQHIGRMESGEQRLNTDHLEQLGAIFGIDPIEVLIDPAEAPEAARAPLLDEVQAGAFAEVARVAERHDFSETEWIRVSYSKPHKFALKVRGDSMDRLLPEGGAVVVDYSINRLETGELGVFRMDGKATFKRLQRRNGDEWLEPDSNNPRHAPIFPAEGAEIEVIGRVVEMIRDPEIIEMTIQEPARRRPRRAKPVAA